MSAAFKDKVVWITGASSGIGEEMVMQLAQQGAILVLSARRESELERIAKASGAKQYLILPFDLSQTNNYTLLLETIVASYGRLDVLINNGGISQRAFAAESTDEAERQLFEVNYFANIALTKACLPLFRKQGHGKIVVISSVAGLFGYFLRSTYAATKHALKGYYESLRFEEKANGLEVYLIYPGRIHTPISYSALTGSGQAHGKMDKGQAEGMPVNECVAKILKAIEKQQFNLKVGGQELVALWLYKYLPKLFFKVMNNRGAD